ncbi:MAG: sigma-70 family RNA polymerase sigma factor, partial [Opitutaceae bacterium]
MSPHSAVPKPDDREPSEHGIDDRELLSRYVRDGAEDAFAELVRRYVDLVYHAALRQVGGDAHRAKDITQTVFTLLARQAVSLGRHEALVGWLHTATRFTARRFVRTEQRRATREQEAHLMQELTREETSSAEWERLRPVIDDVLGDLHAADRDAVLLRFFAARPFAEVGKTLGLSENAARMRVERALEKMRAALAKRGLVSTSAALALALGGPTGLATPATLAATVTGAALAGAKATLVGAAGAGALATGAFFMNKSLVIVSAVVLVAVGTATFQYAVARRSQAAALEISRDRETLRGELHLARQQIAAAERAAATAKEFKTAPASGANSANAAMDPADGAMVYARAKQLAAERQLKALSGEGRQLLDSPEALRQVVANEELQFRAPYRRAGFSPAQIEQFRTLLSQNLQRRFELQSKLAGRDLAAVQAMEDQLAAEFLVDTRTLFGEQTARLIQRHQETQALRTLAEHLASNLFYTDTPLSTGQAERLVDALARDFPNGTS